MEQPLRSYAGNGNSAAHTSYHIEDRSYLSLIKKEIAKEAEALGFSSERMGRLDIIITELVSNLLKYGQRKRELLWKPIFIGEVAGIELLALDAGPGISNTTLAMQDGYSTSGTAGEGLGAIKRLSDTFELYSQASGGTVVLSRLFDRELSAQFDQSFIAAGISVAKRGEKLCGDGYFLEYTPQQQLFRLLMLDGLGHGPEAHLASQEGIETFVKAGKQDDQAQVVKQMHEALKKTRGAVGMALHYDVKEQTIRYCGVGNIGCRLVGFDGTKALFSFNGIIGHVFSSRINDQEISWDQGRLLVMHSDGITSRWDLAKYPQIQKHDPAVIAACLYRDYNRGTDDVTIVVSKQPDADGGKGTKTNH